MLPKKTSTELLPNLLLKRSLILLGGLAVIAYLRLKRLFVNAPTESERRRHEKAKQREIRRTLRGLAPENRQKNKLERITKGVMGKGVISPRPAATQLGVFKPN